MMAVEKKMGETNYIYQYILSKLPYKMTPVCKQKISDATPPPPLILIPGMFIYVHPLHFASEMLQLITFQVYFHLILVEVLVLPR